MLNMVGHAAVLVGHQILEGGEQTVKPCASPAVAWKQQPFPAGGIQHSDIEATKKKWMALWNARPVQQLEE